MHFGPFVGDNDPHLRGSRSDTGEIELRDNLGKLFEFAGQWFVLTVPGGHAPSRFLRRAEIGDLRTAAGEASV